MSKTLNTLVADLPNKEQKAIAKRYGEVHAEYMALQELRKAMKLTQNDVAVALGMEQSNLSKLEHRTDIMLSTLRRYIEATGGSLKLVAEFPQRPPVEIIGFEETLRD